MPTIKDVAKLAGVSHGTVSNILNGYKSVNSDIVKRVEFAMKELGYQPNAKARSLRSSKTGCVGVLLPNIVDNIYVHFYTGIEKIASGAGYSINLYTTGDDPDTEEKLLMRMQQQRVDGAVIITSMPDRTEKFGQLVNSGAKLVFARRKPDGLEDEAFVGIDEKQAVYGVTDSLLRSGYRDIALLTGRERYSNERGCRDGFAAAMAAHGLTPDPNAVKSAAEGKEGAFRVATLWLQSSRIPEVIITTCPEFAVGVRTAAEMFKNVISPRVVTLDNESWVQKIVPSGIMRAVQKYVQLGEAAAQELLTMIDGKEIKQGGRILAAQPLAGALSGLRAAETKKQHPPYPLRVLMLESAPSYASQLMKFVFTQETGIDVDIDTLPYEQMYENTIGCGNRQEYDVIQVNVPWITEAVDKGIITPIDDCFGEGSGIYSQFSPEILEQHGIRYGRVYALPYMSGTQLLFYRKDIFNDLRHQRLYYEKYQSPLRVPLTWNEYDRTAKFFTRKYNPESPVPYGATLGGNGSIYYYMLRLWETGDDPFGKGGPRFDTKNALAALQDLMRAFNFADPAAKDWNQTEQATHFCQGNAAMMVIFQAHFADHIYRYKSQVGRENIGFALLPGNTSILGGWSLGVSPKSKLREQALSYLKWTAEDERAIPYNILGGALPSKIAFDSSEMVEAHPWLPQAREGFMHSRSMTGGANGLSQWEFEALASEVFDKCLSGKLPSKDALDLFQSELYNMIYQK